MIISQSFIMLPYGPSSSLRWNPPHSVNFCRFHWNSGRLALNICACWKYTLELNEETNLKLELGGLEPTHGGRSTKILYRSTNWAIASYYKLTETISYINISIKSVAFFVRFLPDCPYSFSIQQKKIVPSLFWKIS